MFVPITREDFILVGRCSSTDLVVREAARLLPIASEDISQLATRGYTVRMLQDLKHLLSQLRAEPEATRQQRSAHKQPVLAESEVLRAALDALRSGAALLTCAVAGRRGPEGETLSGAREAVSALMEHVQSLGTPCLDPSRLRVRLATLRWLLTLPELGPAASDAGGRAKFVEQLDAIARRLPAIAGLASRPQEPSEFDTMDEVEGRASHNLVLLTRVGRAVFREQGLAQRATVYHLPRLLAS
jgi:hypothetical protein